MESSSHLLITLILSLGASHNSKSYVVVPLFSRYNNSPEQWKLSDLRYNYLYEMIPFNKSETFEIVEVHNEFRRKVNPSASGMKFLEWDEILVENATRSIERCSISKEGNDSQLGENTMFIEGEYFPPKSFLEAWKSSYERFNYSQDFCPEGYRCDNYFQMIVADVTRVGCARKQCDDFIGVSCFYNSKINNGHSPYETGKPCIDCYDDYRYCHNNLCMTKTQCKSMNVECECALKCKNGYDLDEAECKCICEEGDFTTDCSNSSYRCSLKCKHGYVLNEKNCRCVCEEGDDTKDCSNSINKCGRRCDRGYVLDEMKCACVCYSGYCEAFDGYAQQLKSNATPRSKVVLSLNAICLLLTMNFKYFRKYGIQN